MPKPVAVVDKNRENAKWFMVSEKKNGTTYYPKSIPSKRKQGRFLKTSFLTICCFTGAIIANKKDIFFILEAINYGALLLIIVELMYRVLLFYEEYQGYLTSRYGNSIGNLIRHIFYFLWGPIILAFVACVIFLISFMHHGIIDITKFNSVSLCTTFLGLILLEKIVSLGKGPIYNTLKIEENDGLNYGSGMAYSFFYGYLKLILPKSGKQDKNLIEEMEIYSDSQGVPFPVPKLFILIPRSCVCHVSLNTFPNIEESSSLGEKIQTVAGVQNRVYKNSVYKIYDEKKKEKVYVCVEYATPLRTFRLGLEASGVHTDYYRTHSQDIVLQFYLTLKELIKNDPEVMDFCELIYYEDKDENGKFRDVGEMILSRIRKLKKEAKKTQ